MHMGTYIIEARIRNGIEFPKGCEGLKEIQKQERWANGLLILAILEVCTLLLTTLFYLDDQTNRNEWAIVLFLIAIIFMTLILGIHNGRPTQFVRNTMRLCELLNINLSELNKLHNEGGLSSLVQAKMENTTSPEVRNGLKQIGIYFGLIDDTRDEESRPSRFLTLAPKVR